MDPVIRDAAASDAATVAQLLTELGYPASPRFAGERIAEFAVDSASRVAVAELDGRAVGVVAWHIVPRLDGDLRSCRIVDIAVSASARRRGIGRRLIQAVELDARRLGCPRIDLSSGDWRRDAHAFYAQTGFQARSTGFVKRLDAG